MRALLKILTSQEQRNSTKLSGKFLIDPDDAKESVTSDDYKGPEKLEKLMNLVRREDNQSISNNRDNETKLDETKLEDFNAQSPKIVNRKGSTALK